MMLACWPSGVVHGGPKPAIPWGMAVKCMRVPKRPPGEVPRGPMEKGGSDEAGSAALRVAPFPHGPVARSPKALAFRSDARAADPASLSIIGPYVSLPKTLGAAPTDGQRR